MRTLESLAASENFTGSQRGAEVLDSRSGLPWSRTVRQLYNFWTATIHAASGVMRARVQKAEPAWTVVLDLDTLALAEAENWVWKGAQCLPPGDRRCLVALSRGGGDAVVVREFDLGSCDFVRDGFVIAEATGAVWRDLDTLYVPPTSGLER
jgi:prolyl oligopeptidase